MAGPIDPESPVPLYHQIAEAIRGRIRSGKLAPGEALEPLRQAAETWGVNLHTVRHAYAALARDGLVEPGRGRRGARVRQEPASPRRRPSPDEAMAHFIERISGEAADIYGLTAADLAALLTVEKAAASTDRPAVYVVECSEWQCRSHAREIESRFDVDVKAWPLHRETDPPAGAVISTYFHYNDIRRRWPRRLNQMHFITIYPDPTLRQQLSGVTRVRVWEKDRPTTEAMAADLVALFDDLQVEPVVASAPASALEITGEGRETPVLFAPRVWAEMSEALRDHPLTMELRYVLDPVELEEIAGTLKWPRAVERSQNQMLTTQEDKTR